MIKSIKYQILNIKKWARVHKTEFILLTIILLIAAFVRLYRVDEYMTFLGDEGRDAIIVRNIWVKLHPPLIGPVTSIGNMYLGPLYYYLSAPFLLLFGFSPIGPSVMVALFGIATVFLVWFVCCEWFPSERWIHVGALAAAFLYAIAPVVIIYNRSSWNPNIMPFFSLLCVYSAWRVWQRHEWKWFVVLGISFAFVVQSHYLGLILAPVMGVFFLVTLLQLYIRISTKNSKSPRIGPHSWELAMISGNSSAKMKRLSFWKYSFIGLVLFLLLMSPLAIFDARHGWNNFSAIKTFFTVRQDTVSANPLKSLPELFPLWQQICARLLGGTNVTAGRWAAFGLLDGTLAILLMKWWHKKKIPHAFYLLIVWILISLVGLASYKHELYDHYHGFLFTAPFLLLGGITQDVIDVFSQRKKIAKLIAYGLVIISLGGLIYINVVNSPLKYPPNRQLQRSVTVSQKIEEEAHGEKLNLAVIAERNYEGA